MTAETKLTGRASLITGLSAALLGLAGVACNHGRLSSGTAVASSEQASICTGEKTPPDRGPPPPRPTGRYFRPGSAQRRNIREPGMPGVWLNLSGRVYDEDCKPVARALLDFFQADSHGKYDRRELRLHGHQFTDGQGRYVLRTIVPLNYLNRPPQIHVKVQAPDGPVLGTQLFFPATLRAYGMRVGRLNARARSFNPALAVHLGPRRGNRYSARFDFVIAVA
jgi:protocatechuate 3,4-dioxygenase beta subunit